MLLALLTCLGALLGSLRQDAGEDALPPSARFGLAWEKGAALEPETLVTLGTQHGALAVPEVAALVSNDTFFERHVQVLGLWGDEAQSAAAQAGLEYVLVLERARGKSSKPVSREYADPQGRTARLRYTGAEWEVQVSLRARRQNWSEVLSLEERGATAPPWTLSSAHLGDKVETEVDPERALGVGVTAGIDRALGQYGALLLWQERERWSAAGSEDPRRSSPWTWMRCARRGGARPVPRASLVQRARLELPAWQARWNQAHATESPAGTCGWCAGAVDAQQGCACAESAALESLLNGVGALLRESGMESAGLPTNGLNGHDPRAVFARSATLDRALGDLPGRYMESLRSLRWNGFPGRFGDLRVVIYAQELEARCVQGFDPDLASSGSDLVVAGLEDLDPQLETWGLKLKAPAAALVRLDLEHPRAKVKRLKALDLRKAEAQDLQALFAQALAAALEGR